MAWKDWFAKSQDARRTSSLERPESKCAKTRSICAKDGKDLLPMKLCLHVKSEGLLGLHHLQAKFGLSSWVLRLPWAQTSLEWGSYVRLTNKSDFNCSVPVSRTCKFGSLSLLWNSNFSVAGSFRSHYKAIFFCSCFPRSSKAIQVYGFAHDCVASLRLFWYNDPTTSTFFKGTQWSMLVRHNLFMFCFKTYCI